MKSYVEPFVSVALTIRSEKRAFLVEIAAKGNKEGAVRSRRKEEAFMWSVSVYSVVLLILRVCTLQP